MDRRIADDAAIRASPSDFELRLHEGDDAEVRAVRERRGDRAEDQPERDERDVDDGEPDSLAERRRRQVPGVESIVDDDPRIAGDTVRELPSTDVDRVDPSGVPLQQDVGEAAGRGAGVEADLSGWVDRERVEGRRELGSAATHVGLGGDELDREVRLDDVTRLPVDAGGVARSRPDPAAEDEGLGSRACVGKTPLDDELVEPLSGTGAASRRGAHRAIVAQRPSPRLTGGEFVSARSAQLGIRTAMAVLLTMGISGISVGVTLGSASMRAGLPASGVAVPAGLIVYGLAVAGGGLGILLRRRWGWPLGVGAIVVGLVTLVILLGVVGGRDAILTGGIVLWGATLGLLLLGWPARPR